MSKERLHKLRDGDAVFHSFGSHGDREPLSQTKYSELLNGLYNDAFDRQEKMKSIQDAELERIKSASIDLSRSKIVLANKIASQTFLAYHDICKVIPVKETLVDRVLFFKLLSRLGFLADGHEPHEKALALEAWNILEERENVEIQNLITFFLAVQNIFVEQMQF